MFNDINKEDLDLDFLFSVKGTADDLIEFVDDLESRYIRSQKGYMLTDNQIHSFKRTLLDNKEEMKLISFYSDFDLIELVIESDDLQVKLPFYTGELNILISEVPIFNYSLDKLIALEGTFNINNIGIFNGDYTIYKGVDCILVIKRLVND